MRNLGWAGSVFQYTGLYCSEEGLKSMEIILQEGRVYCNTVECMGFKTVLKYSLMGSRCYAIEQPGCWRKYIAIHYSVS